MYLKFQADHIYSDGKLWDKNFVLVTDPNGRVEGIVPVAGAGEGIRYTPGVITPGHINCHCHLELSYMHGAIPEATGLTRFVAAVMKTSPADTETQLTAMEAAAKEMRKAGIVAVADISNHGLSLQPKIHSQLYWHNFLEISNLDDDRAPGKLETFRQLQARFRMHFPQTVLAPHAIYSVSPETFRLINQYTAGEVIAIHNQECLAEDELMTYGTGKFLPFYESIGRTHLPVTVAGKSSLQTWLPYFNNGQTILLVHNTFTSETDILFALDYAAANGLQLYFCLCPNANMYIEQSLPPVDKLIQHGCKVVLGTDSYASNWQLNIAKEAAMVKQHFPSIPDTTLLEWMTGSGASALGIQQQSGTFKKGTQPGVVLVQPDFSASEKLI